MTQMENEEMVLTATIKQFLSQTARWSRFLGIVGFVFSGMILLSAMGDNNAEATAMLGISTSILPVIYFLMGLFYLVPSYFLFQFGTKTRAALEANDQEGLTQGMQNLRSMFTFFGVSTALILVFYLITLITMVAG